MIKTILTTAFCVLLLFLLAPFALAEDRFVTIVNPIRGRGLWINKKIDVFWQQAEPILQENLTATWLLQYDALVDHRLIEAIKKLPKSHEVGVFLEVSEALANKAYVPYLLGEGDWARPDKVYLSGYTLQERKRMIDVVMGQFKEIFGYYPKSVGGWYIDAPSLSYLKDKYNITASLGVADQYNTDALQAWGQYWGVPYYPSLFNSLVPAQRVEDKLKVVKIQWALRDPVLGYGPTPFYSNYSLQANDYQREHKLDINYFEKLLDLYLSTQFNHFGQATVGLEVGQEGFTFLKEFRWQIKVIAKKKREGVRVVTMSQFARYYQEKFPQVSPEHIIVGKDLVSNKKKTAFWYMSPFYRVGILKENDKLKIRDLRIYNEKFKERDFYQADKRKAVYRVITAFIDGVALENEKVLGENIGNLTFWKEGENFIISFQKKELVLMPEKILFEGKVKFDASKKRVISGFPAFLARIQPLLAIGEKAKERVIGLLKLIRYSRIDNQYIIGIRIGREKILGYQPPFSFRVFKYPFQILSRFKSPADFLDNFSFLISDAQIEALSFLSKSKIERDKLLYLKREEVNFEKLKKFRSKKAKRIFENSEVEIWKLR